MGRPVLFWDVDTQFDFILPGGKLYVPGAEQIVPNLAQLTQFARLERIPVLSSSDTHQPNDPEFAQYPPHCVVGTPGQQKLPETLLPSRLFVPNTPIELPAELSGYEQFIVEKASFEVFTNPNVDELRRRLAPQEIVLYGVVTEICVWLAARELLARGHHVRLVTDAVRALEEPKGRALLDEMARRGATLTSTVEVVRAAQTQTV